MFTVISVMIHEEYLRERFRKLFKEVKQDHLQENRRNKIDNLRQFCFTKRSRADYSMIVSFV